jgi:hypothetical protein
MRRRVRGVVTVGVAAFAMLAFASGAGALCPCKPFEMTERLADDDKALVGTVVSKKPHWNRWSEPGSRYTVRVEHSLNIRQRGDVTVDVVTDPACDAEWAVGERVGAFVSGSDRYRLYEARPCDIVDPKDLLAAAKPLPRASGRGRPAFLVAGGFHGSRVIALSPSGRVLAYGFGPGSVYDISVCPGSRFALELLRRDAGRMFVAVRDMQTFEIVDNTWFGGVAGQVHCLDRRGRRAYAGFVNSVFCLVAPCDAQPKVRLIELRFRDGSVESRSLPGGSLAFAGQTAFVGGPEGLMATEFGKASVRVLHRDPGASDIVVSPGGGRAAYATTSGPRVLDLDTRRVARLPTHYRSPLTWITDSRLLLSGTPDAAIFDTRSRSLRSLPYQHARGVPRDGRLFAAEESQIVATQISNGNRRRLLRVPGLGLALVGVTDARRLRASRRTPEIARFYAPGSSNSLRRR